MDPQRGVTTLGEPILRDQGTAMAEAQLISDAEYVRLTKLVELGDRDAAERLWIEALRRSDRPALERAREVMRTEDP